jgi:hypothetical protein
MAFAASCALDALLLWFFHRRFWYPPDEGNYAHIAQRLLEGQVLNRDIQDIAGYTNFLHAAAFRIFGLDLLSLRYPLVLAAFCQSALIFWAFPRRAPLAALVASLAVNVLGLLQFLNPTAHWYCLFLVIAIAAVLGWRTPNQRARLVLVGILLGTSALFRLLSGLLVGIGVLACLVREDHREARGRQVVLERVVIAVAAFVLTAYLARATNAVGWVLLGGWPLLLLGWLWKNAAAPNRAVARTLALVALGAAIAALPMALYHVAHGSVGAWLSDLGAVPRTGTSLPFLRLPIYWWMVLLSLIQLPTGALGALGALYWLGLLLAAPLNALLVLRRCSAGDQAGVPALSILAVFYAVVSVHYQVPLYLNFSVGLSVASVLLLLAQRSRHRAAAVVVALFVCFALRFQAAQPISRGLAGTVASRRAPLLPSVPLPRSHLWIEPDERERYAQLLGLIDRESNANETLLSIPSNAELYFLSGRRNPFRFYNTALGLADEEALLRAEAALLAAPPRLVVFAPGNKYNTDLSRRLMQFIRERYALLQTIDGFEVYGRSR